MKGILLFAGVLVMSMAVRTALAQAEEGVIRYEVKINLHRNLPDGREEMKKMMPQFRTHHEQLFFTSSESLYKPIDEEEDDGEFGNAGEGRVRMQVMRPDAEIYTNRETSQRITRQEFMGKMYIIEDSLSIHAWKFGGETKTILGYECRQARFSDEERKQNIVAWYTTALRPFLGPVDFDTLPGGVLQVDINEGQRVITATAVETRTLKKNEMKVPKGGTKITSEEFRKMMEEQMERMRANGANVMIKN